MKRFLIIFTAFLIIIPLVRAQTNPALEIQIEETRRQRDALVAEQRRIQAELDEIASEGRTLTGAVKTLDTTKRKLENDLRITQSGIQGANLTISKLTSNIETKEEAIELHKEALRESILKIAEYDQEGFIFNILAYENISDAWSDTTSLMNIGDSLGEEIDGLRATQKVLEEDVVAKEAQRKNLQSLQGQLSGQRKIVTESQTAKSRLLAETKSQEAAYQKLLRDNIARQKQFEALLFQFESQIKAGDRSLVPRPMRGLLAWPLDNPIITQQFGRTAGASRLYASGSHNGVDFRASMGTRVLSMGNGTIIGQGNTDNNRGCYSYGRWILIKYDNGLTSVYGHLSGSIVSIGQSVTRGQVVGYSGGQPGVNGSGYSTGPHLHVGLFGSGNVRVAQYTTSINCKSAVIPLANPSDYLNPLAYLP
ncbi:MAG: peptidoglycan DD-metalloendopeptidase family protein [Parcubacteria group bacterium]